MAATVCTPYAGGRRRPVLAALSLLVGSSSFASALSPAAAVESGRRPVDASLLPDATVADADANANAGARTHTLILCRHGDSIWNGGHPGHAETFTGWTDVPLSPRGVREATQTASQLAATYPYGIDACFTSLLGRARLTAHDCVWAYGTMPSDAQVRKFVSDYRLNERHYGSLQGLVKERVEKGEYGHDPLEVKGWRRSWRAVPPLLEEEDPRRLEEIKKFGHACRGAANVPRGESLEMVARHRIRPFLEEVLTPTLDGAEEARAAGATVWTGAGKQSCEGGTGLVVAHANSLRALIGVICDVEKDPAALQRLERMKIQTGVPLVLQYRRRRSLAREESAEVGGKGGGGIGAEDSLCFESLDVLGQGSNDNLPVYPLSSVPQQKLGGAVRRREW